MGQKCTMKRPAYDAGKIEEERTDNRIDPNDIRGNGRKTPHPPLKGGEKNAGQWMKRKKIIT